MTHDATFECEQTLWKEGFDLVAGVDEVGMGCLAGPVVAAAVILSKDASIEFLRDSKTLAQKKREQVAAIIKEKAVAWGIGEASLAEIEEFNIRGADFLAMKRALASLAVAPQAVLSDGFSIPGISVRHQAIIKGDQKCKSIAAASIVAKVYRDNLMANYDRQFPGYFFAKNKGYGTADHLTALNALGPCELHRVTYAPVREAMERRHI